MLDLGLFKIPAFVGLSVVAFTLAASIFAMFLYLTLYIQDDLGYGPLAAGVRFLPITLLIFFVAFFAGRLTVRVQSRYLLGVGHAARHRRAAPDGDDPPGLDLDRAAARLHRRPASGIGIVNPVLASGAVSVVQPQRSGMASGANNTFRQVGIATGIAVLGRRVPEPDRDATPRPRWARPPSGREVLRRGGVAAAGRHVGRRGAPGGRGHPDPGGPAARCSTPTTSGSPPR